MKNWKLFAGALVFVLALVFTACPAGGGGEDPEFAIPAMEFVQSMKIGWNLGNTLDGHNNGMPSETAWQSAVTTQALMDGVKASGFGAVRIPVTWIKKIGPAPDYTIDAAWLNRVAEVVGYAKNAGLKAIINIHHDGADSSYWLSVKTDALTGDKKTAIDDQYKAVWTQIAEKFKDEGSYLIFEAFNELHDGTYGDGNTAQRNRINELDQIFVDTVRATGGNNANRFLVIPGWLTRPSITVSNLVLPTDTANDKLIVTFHYYDPYDFTGSAKDTTWGAGSGNTSTWANEAYLKDTFNKVKNKFAGTPVIIGEYGAVNQAGKGYEYRKYFMEYVTKYAHDCGFVPFYWDNNGWGNGSEKFGLLQRTDGKPTTANNGTEILQVIMKAVNDDYSIDSIEAPTP